MTRPADSATPTEPARAEDPTEPTRPIEFFRQPTEPTRPIEFFAQPTPVLSPDFAEPTIEFAPDPRLLAAAVKAPVNPFHELENLTALSAIFHTVTPVEPMSIAQRYVEHPTPAPRTEPLPSSAGPTLVDAHPGPFFEETTTEPCIETVTEPLLAAPADFENLLTVETSAPSWQELEAKLNVAAPPCDIHRQPAATGADGMPAPPSGRASRLQPSWTPDSGPGLFPGGEMQLPGPRSEKRRRSVGKTAPTQIVPVAVATFTLLSASAVFSWLLLGNW